MLFPFPAGFLLEDDLVPPADADSFTFPALFEFPKNECIDFFFGAVALDISRLFNVLFSPATATADRVGYPLLEDNDDVDPVPPDEKNDEIDLCLLCGCALRVWTSSIRSRVPTRSDSRLSFIKRDTAM